MEKIKLAQISTFFHLNLEFQDTPTESGVAALLKVFLKLRLKHLRLKINVVKEQLQISAPSSAEQEIYSAIQEFCAEQDVEWKPLRTYFLVLDTATGLVELPVKMFSGEFDDPKIAVETLLATAKSKTTPSSFSVLYTVIGPDGVVAARDIFRVGTASMTPQSCGHPRNERK